MSLRVRIIGAFLLLISIVVGIGTASHLADVSFQLEQSLRRQATRETEALGAEFALTRQSLRRELAALRASGVFSSGRQRSGAGPFAEARELLETGRLDVVKLIGARGEIQVSGHWPSSFGALDPLHSRYSEKIPSQPILVDEPTPMGNALAMEQWTKVGRGRGSKTLVVGRFLDESTLETIRMTVGADMLAVCRGAAGKKIMGDDCPHMATDESVIAGAVGSNWADGFVLTSLPLSISGEETFYVVAGVSRADVDRIKYGIIRRSLWVGLGSGLLALLLGLLIARRMTRPVEALATAVDRVADGDLDVRVPLEAGEGSPEVTQLVDAFHQMAADLGRSRKHLQRAERVAAWQEIARGLAHELKNPLTPIRGAMDVIRKARRLGREDFDEILEEQATAVVEEVDRLKDLSDAFARFARLPEPQPEFLNPAEIFDNATALYVPADAGVRVVRDFEEHLNLYIDRKQLATALTNLIKNAVEAMDGEGTLWLGAKTLQTDSEEEIELSVEDSGTGLTQDTQDRLFTPYFTTKGSRGTGLGLALVHRIIVGHGGQIFVEAGRTGGARFVLRLPKGNGVNDVDVGSTQ